VVIDIMGIQPYILYKNDDVNDQMTTTPPRAGVKNINRLSLIL